MNNFQQHPLSPASSLQDDIVQSKKRKICESSTVMADMDSNRENAWRPDNRACFTHGHAAGRHFIHLRHHGDESIFQTEEWQPSGSTLFSPIIEDLMINTRHIEQFSCSRGNFFVAGQKGVYSRTLAGDVLHFWRFCPQKKKLFISRSFLFANSEDFYQVQQLLQNL